MKKSNLPAANGAGGTPTGPLPSGALQLWITSSPVTADTPLQVGDVLQAEWSGSWWSAEVVGLRSDGRVKIHYPGWDASWDEVVPRSRLRVEKPGPHRVKVTLDNGASLTGDFVAAGEGFLVLSRSGRKRTFVNQDKVVYFELGEE